MYRFKAEVIRACFVIIIKIYKVTNLSFLIIVKSTIRYLPLRCSGVEVKVSKFGITQVKYKYLQIVLKYST